MNHKNCNILGEYDWTCKRNLSAGTPGWPRPNHSEGPYMDMGILDVVWGDGTHDDSRECSICATHNCPNPVHGGEHYKVRLSAKAKAWDAQNPVI